MKEDITKERRAQVARIFSDAFIHFNRRDVFYRALKPVVNDCLHVVAELDDALALEGAQKPRVALGYLDGDFAGVNVTVYHVKTTEAIKIWLRAFAAEGYYIRRTTDFPEIQRKSWHLYKKNDREQDIVIVVHFFFSDVFDPDECSFIPNGSKQQTTYKFTYPKEIDISPVDDEQDGIDADIGIMF